MSTVPAHTDRPPLTVTLGGGGAYALGFHLGIAVGLAYEGIDISRSPLMGTSGGSHAAAALATGMSFDEVCAIWQPYVDSARSLWVDALPLAEDLYGDRTIIDGARPGGVTVRLRGFKREVLWAPEYTLPEIVAASSSPFPFVRPTKVGGRRYVDGGHRSGTSCDRAIDADLQLALVPFAFKAQGLVGRMGARQVVKQPPKWEARTGGRTLIVSPDEEMQAVEVKNMKAMGDTGLGREIYDRAIPLGRRLAARLRDEHPEVVQRV